LHRFEGSPVVEEPRWKLQLPALYWGTVVPDEHNLVPAENRDDYGEVVKHESGMVHSKPGLGDQSVHVKLDFS